MAEEAKSMKTAKPSAMTTAAKAPEEMENAPAPEENEGGWKRFVWNEDTREFLGRTGKSWFLISVFYIIFFASLAAFFMVNWFGTLAFITHDAPWKQGEKGFLDGDYRGPGLAARPTPDKLKNGISSLIWFGVGSYEDYRFWSLQLDDWFDNIPKKDAKDVMTCPTEDKKKSCLIEVDPGTSMYGQCSPSKGPIHDYGYIRGEPCVLLKMNRVYGWKPQKCDGKCWDKAPNALKTFMDNKPAGTPPKDDLMFIWCEGENQHDKENLGAMEYFPGPYIERKYFNFYNQKNYQSPFMMIHLKRPIPGALISIVCKAYANNIGIDKLESIGYTNFQVMAG